MLQLRSYKGTAAQAYIPDLARLRIRVFREFPYLYDGSWEYEMGYLQALIAAPDSIVVVAFDGDQVIGASTAMPLAQETENIRKPWLERGYDLDRIFYYSESVLLPDYRGRGIGVRFFEAREAWARELGRFNLITFCAVVRPDDHPHRPADYMPLHDFWGKRGFRKAEGMICYIPWLDIEEEEATAKPLQFWYKELSGID